jgi:uncharacterized protein (DUF39 family)
MCSSGAFLNFGHSNPPIKMGKITLNNIPAYTGIAAVDAYIGATELSENMDMNYGGAHVIEDLIAGKDIELYSEAYGTDCYPRKEIKTKIKLKNLNQAYMYNPRNAYQNYAAAINTTDKVIKTYMGTLLPKCGNITYSTSGELSPLLNDPDLKTIGLGTRIFLGGGIGYVTWEGTQHFTGRQKNEKGVPIGPAGSLAVSGDLKGMSTDFIRAAVFEGYGVTLFVGIGIPIPIIDEDILIKTAIRNKDIQTNIYDYGKLSRDILKVVDYEELRSGSVEIDGKPIPSAPLSSLKKAREIAGILKNRITKGEFLLTKYVDIIPDRDSINSLKIREGKE